MNIKNKTVLITGGASGIGKIMGRKVLERGAKTLIIWDINADALQTTVQEFSRYDGKVYSYVVDVTDLNAIEATAAIIRQQFEGIDLLINNAGIVVGKYFHEHTYQDISRTMRINADALMHTTLEFLPQMMTKNYGSICNICSSAGLISNPKMSVYAASKWAAVGWSDSLRLEMKQLNKDIAVTTIMPFYINTGMFHGVSSKILPILEPEPTAERIIKAVEQKKKLLAMPLPYWFIRLSQGILPLPLFEWAMQKMGIYDGMKTFKGRS